MTMGRRLMLGFGLALALSHTASADLDPAETAGRAAEMLEQAGFALLEADSARDRVEALTDTVRAYEEGLLALREGIRQAALRERTIVLVFEAERDRLARLLGVLQAIESAPAPILMMHPEGPLGTARSGMIVSEVTPAVAREAQALRAQLEELAILRSLQANALGQLSQALDQAQTARSALSQAIADRGPLPERFVTDATAMQRLVESVDSLDSLADILAADPPEGTADLPGFDGVRGDLRLPVLGALLRRFNETDAAGVTRPGMVFATRPAALVTTPWPATVRYAGPLLDYGNVIILEPDGRYLLILGGLGDLFVAAGQLISTHAPLGLMPGAGGDSEELILPGSQDTGAGLTETLYIELREDGSPINPEDWFTASGWQN
jgi:septal ring factor EnvC (AmiA/AmiB activator)